MTDATSHRVRCHYCGALVRIRKNGTMWMHHPAVDPGASRKCAGTGREPK